MTKDDLLWQEFCRKAAEEEANLRLKKEAEADALWDTCCRLVAEDEARFRLKEEADAKYYSARARAECLEKRATLDAAAFRQIAPLDDAMRGIDAEAWGAWVRGRERRQLEEIQRREGEKRREEDRNSMWLRDGPV